jgi:hypothetical protein
VKSSSSVFPAWFHEIASSFALDVDATEETEFEKRLQDEICRVACDTRMIAHLNDKKWKEAVAAVEALQSK